MLEDTANAHRRAGSLLRRHPILLVTFAACIALGAALGVTYLPADWSMARRLAGGSFAGAGIAVFLTVTRLFAVLE